MDKNILKLVQQNISEELKKRYEINPRAVRQQILEVKQRLDKDECYKLYLLYHNEYRYVRMFFDACKFYINDLKDDFVNLKDEKWKRLYTYESQAVAQINMDNKEVSRKKDSLDIIRWLLNWLADEAKMAYYDVKHDLWENRDQDIQASQLWKSQPWL